MRLNINPDGYKKCVAVRQGVIYHSPATYRKKAGLPLKAPLPLRCTPIGRLGVIQYIYETQWAGKQKNTTTNNWNFLLFD